MAATLRNAGTLLGTDTLTLSVTDALDNLDTGKPQSRGNAVFNTARMTNLGEWQAENIALTADSLTNDGVIQSSGALTLMLDSATAAGALHNAGTLSVGGDTTLRAVVLDNQGAITSRGAALLDALSLQNDGSVTASENLTLRGNYQGSGALSSAVGTSGRSAKPSAAGQRH